MKKIVPRERERARARARAREGEGGREGGRESALACEDTDGMLCVASKNIIIMIIE